jgi:hypothetical protein
MYTEVMYSKFIRITGKCKGNFMSDEKINCENDDQDQPPYEFYNCERDNLSVAWRVVIRNGDVYLTRSFGWYVLTINHGFLFIPHIDDASPPLCIAMNTSDEYYYTEKEARAFMDTWGDGSAYVVAKMHTDSST